jgi:parallel beta-helix repeat protein
MLRTNALRECEVPIRVSLIPFWLILGQVGHAHFLESEDMVMKATHNSRLANTWLAGLFLAVAAYVLPMGSSYAQVVNCPGDSIGATLAAAPPGPVFLTINGICTENVVIERDRVQLIAGSPGSGVTGAATFNAITIFGQGVVIDGLTVSNGGGVGIALFDNGSARIRNSTVQDNAGFGVEVAFDSFARLDNNTISGNSCDVIIFDSGAAWLADTTIVSNQADTSICGGLSLYRDAFVRMRGANSVTNTAPTGLAIDVWHGSTLRQDGGHSAVSGDVRTGNHSNMDFRDVDITGDVSAFYNSVLRFRDQGSVPNNVTVTGDININETNIAHFSSAASTVNGTVHCDGGTLFGSTNVLATAIDCPAPVHVLRADGTAQIRVEEIIGVTQPRNMFELRNNGPVGFNMFNTNTNQRWRFAAQVDGFRINIADAGDAGPEMIVFQDGSVQMGKNQAQQFFLDTSGNVTIQGTLTELSDVNAKEAFTPVDGKTVLARLEDLPITQWRYKRDASKSPHLGPTAQDFHAAFGLGAGDTHLAPKDMAAVALVGVKELNSTLQKEIEAREAEIATLKQRLAALETALNRVLAAQRSARLAAVRTGQQH